MTSRIPLCLIVCSLSAVGCQSLNSMLPWTAKNNGYTLDELSDLETQSAELNLDPAFKSGVQPANVSQASYTQSSGPKPFHSQQSIPELMAAGRQAIQQGAAGAVGQIAKARNLFESVLDQDRQHTDAHHGVAMSADLQQDWDAAIYHYKQALRNRPNDANLLNDLGYSYLLQNRIRESRTNLQQALEIDPEHKFAVKNLARLSLTQGNKAEAQRILATLYPPQQVQEEFAKLTALVAEAASSASSVAASVLPELPKNASPEQVLQRMKLEKERAMTARNQRTLGQTGHPVSHTNLTQPAPFQPRTNLANTTGSNAYSQHPPVSIQPISAPSLNHRGTSVTAVTLDPPSVTQQALAAAEAVANHRQPSATVTEPQPFSPGQSNLHHNAMGSTAHQPMPAGFHQSQPQSFNHSAAMNSDSRTTMQPMTLPQGNNFAQHPSAFANAAASQASNFAPPLSHQEVGATANAQYPTTTASTRHLGTSTMKPMVPRRQPAVSSQGSFGQGHSVPTQQFQPGLIQQLTPGGAVAQPHTSTGFQPKQNHEMMASMHAMGVSQPTQERTPVATASYPNPNPVAFGSARRDVPVQGTMKSMGQFPQNSPGGMPVKKQMLPTGQPHSNTGNDPLMEFERTLQKLDQQYNQAMQHAHGSRL